MTENLPVLVDAPIEEVLLIEMRDEKLLEYPHKFRPGTGVPGMQFASYEYQWMLQEQWKDEYTKSAFAISTVMAAIAEEDVPERLRPKLEEYDVNIEYRYKFYVLPIRNKEGKVIRKVEHILGPKYSRLQVKIYDRQMVKVRSRVATEKLHMRVLRLPAALVHVLERRYRGPDGASEKRLPEKIEFIVDFMKHILQRPGTKTYEEFMDDWRESLLTMDEEELKKGLDEVRQ